VSSACVTFPWMMHAGEVEELEGMRGSVHSWRTMAVPCDKSDDANVEGDDGMSAFIALTTIVATTKHEKKRDKTVAEMTPLERYHHRRERKEQRNRADAKRKEDERMRGLCREGVRGEKDEGKKDESEDDEDNDDDKAAVESIRGPFVARRIKARSIEH
jgi:hypothetical protein